MSCSLLTQTHLCEECHELAHTSSLVEAETAKILCSTEHLRLRWGRGGDAEEGQRVDLHDGSGGEMRDCLCLTRRVGAIRTISGKTTRCTVVAVRWEVMTINLTSSTEGLRIMGGNYQFGKFSFSSLNRPTSAVVRSFIPNTLNSCDGLRDRRTLQRRHLSSATFLTDLQLSCPTLSRTMLGWNPFRTPNLDPC